MQAGLTTDQIAARLAGFPPDSPLVAVPIFNAYEEALACVARLCATLPGNTPVLLIDDASTDPRVAAMPGALRDARLHWLAKPENRGFVDSVNLALTLAGRRDVVLVNSDVEVPPGWLARLRDAAYATSTVATATPLSNNGGILSVPERAAPRPGLPEGWDLERVDRAIQAASRRTHPAIPSAVGYCTYIRRSAVDMVGLFDTAFSPGYGEEVDFCQRAAGFGLAHVAADDLFVLHHGSRSFDRRGAEWRRRLQESHEALIARRYPWYHAWVAEAVAAQGTPLAEALARARRAILPRRVAVDATGLRGGASGTETVVVELIRALGRLPEAGELAVIVAGDSQRATLAALGLGEAASRAVPAWRLRAGERFDVIVRPYQIYEPHELALLRGAADRLLIFHLDSIRNSIPAYAASAADWQDYRALARLAFAQADGVAFISEDARGEAARAGLRVPPERARVILLGLDHRAAGGAAERPAGVPDRPFLLMLGADYRHKNRPLAIRALEALVAERGWDGALVLAGHHMPAGGSAAEERALLAARPDLAARVADIGPVTEAGKRWLLERAAAVLYPSTTEGFGLVPFEAAAAGTPALAARGGSLAEVIGGAPASLEGADPREAAEQIWRLLTDGELRARQVAWLRGRAAPLTWRAAAEQTLALARDVEELPPRLAELGALGEADVRALVESSRLRVPLPVAPGLGAAALAARRWRRRGALALRAARVAGPAAAARSLYRFARWRLGRA